MTEEQWFTAKDPQPMLHYIQERITQRQERLFRSHCCQSVRNLLGENASSIAILQGNPSEEDLAKIRSKVRISLARTPLNSKWEHALNELLRMGSTWNQLLIGQEAARALDKEHEINPLEREWQANVLRDLVPYYKVSIHPDEQVRMIAQTIYNEDRYCDLPILADALEDSGCQEYYVLNHCRHQSTHYKGCWVIDQILGL